MIRIPSDNGAILFKCCKCGVSGEDLRDTGLEIRANGTAVTATVGIAPSENGAVLFQCRKAAWLGRWRDTEFVIIAAKYDTAGE